MAGSEPIEVEILTDGDTLRQERLTRSLHAELSGLDGIDVRFPPETRDAEPGAKGAEIIADASLWVFLSTATGATARVLVAAIHAWSSRERHRVVRVKAGGRSVEIPSNPTESHERIIQALLDADKK